MLMRIRDTLADEGLEVWQEEEVLEVISSTLHGELAPQEISLMEAGESDDGTDWMAAILKLRLERAHLSGMECARKQALGDDDDSNVVGLGLALLRQADPGKARELGERLEDSVVAVESSLNDQIQSAIRGGTDVDDPLIGTLFHEKYRIIRCLGSGGFGAVYEALDERGVQNSVAIKVMLPGAARTRVHLEAFRGEAARVTRLSHPNIVDWKTFDQTPDGRYYFVMELLNGEELDRILRREGKLETRRAMDLMLQILGALRAAHFVGDDESILHLDLKPRNIIVLPAGRSRGERAKVIDFGIGQYVGGEDVALDAIEPVPSSLPRQVDWDPQDTQHTSLNFATSSISVASSLGDGFDFKLSQACTPEYASPEQSVHIRFANGQGGEPQRLDCRADIYSFGVLAYQMLTGRLPYPRPEQRHEYLSLHTSRPIDPWTKEDQQIPRALRKFVERCLRKDPDTRWNDTHEALADLSEIVEPKRSTRLRLVVPVLLLLLAIATAAVLTRESMVETLELSSAGKGRLVGNSQFYLGREQSSLLLRMGDEDGLGLMSEDPVFELRDPLTADLVDGWACMKDGDALRITRSGARDELSQRSMQVWTEDGGFQSRAFGLTWIANDSWKAHVLIRPIVGNARKLEVDLLATPNVSIDAKDLDLVIEISGDARTLVNPPVVNLGALVLSQTSYDDEEQGLQVYRYSLARALSLEGATSWSFEAEGLGGKIEGDKGELTLVNNELNLDSVTLAVIGGSECRKEGGGTYLVLPEERLELIVTTNRPAFITWKAKGGGEHAATSSAVELKAELGELPEERGAFWIAVSAEERNVVNVVEGHATNELVHLLLIPNEEPISISFDQGGTLLELESAGLVYASSPKLDMSVSPRSMGFKTVEVGGVLPNGNLDPLESFADVKTDAHSISLAHLEEGLNELYLRVLPQLGYGKPAADQPTVENRITVLVDTCPPELSMTPPIPDDLFITGAEEATLKIEAPAADYESPVDWNWTVKRVSDGSIVMDEHSEASGEIALDMTSREFDGNDGAYELRITAQDRAGNSMSDPLTWSFERALDGPLIDLESPEPPLAGTDRLWPIHGTSELQIDAYLLDPNGIGVVGCEVYRGDRQGVQVLEQEQTEFAQGGAQNCTWRFDVPFSWSGADDVHIQIWSKDSRGASSPPDLFGPFRISEFKRPRPAGITVARNGGSANAMRLVLGNDQETFSLGGQSASRENKRFEEAGLDGSYWVSPDSSSNRKKPWNLEFGRGWLGDFYLDKREVSVGQFQEFLRDEVRGYLHTEHWLAGVQPKPTRLKELRDQLGATEKDLPVTRVTWLEANAYAHWVGKRLPTLLEHQYATRGGAEYRAYSCFAGEKWDAELKSEWQASRPRSCMGSSEDQTHDTGILDLACNVSEWTQSPYGDPRELTTDTFLAVSALPVPESDRYWVAGGSYKSQAFDFSNVEGIRWSSKRAHIGFRCAISAESVLEHLDFPGRDPLHLFQEVGQ